MKRNYINTRFPRESVRKLRTFALQSSEIFRSPSASRSRRFRAHLCRSHKRTLQTSQSDEDAALPSEAAAEMRSGGSRSYQTSVIDGQAEPSVRSFAPILCAGHMAKRLAIVGAGAAGLLAARKFFEYGGFEISVFEQSENIGGTWVYSSDTNVHSSLYEKMTTNLPKEVMYYPGSPFRQETNGESFVPHQVVRQYLEDYAKNIRHLIKFNHTVLKVERIDEKWSVTTQASSEHPKIEVFDVVFVCSGHYTDPSYPLTKHEFSGRSLHSHNYRRAEYYKGQTVAVIGAGNSGMDISLQVSAEAEKSLIDFLIRCICSIAMLPSILFSLRTLKKGNRSPTSAMTEISCC
ncbi:hypothetical protein L596_007097 [Steinernema carpocapsae]|uniref:Flavin-containing monooxygenase n=1 Tax=Steinernema carpocapsae TaxID=34508 RepID=A0A4U5P863_STECR|nr:hypothetical protein L596_007097 [Steinernema carpocapsae]